MRWFILLAVLGGIFWTANWSYHHVDNAILITDFWKAESSPSEWGLVNFKDSTPVIYEYVGTKGFWHIFKGLWPVWTLFILSFFILVPLSIYIFNGLNNAQIAAAKEAQLDAEEQARKADSDAAYSGDSGHRLRFNRTPTIPSFSLTLFLPYLSGLCQFSH